MYSDVFVRVGVNWVFDEDPDLTAEDLAAATFFDLVSAFRGLAEKKPEAPSLKFIVETKTIGERITEVTDFLKERKRGTCSEICAADQNQGESVLSFLAVLELARTGCLRLYQNLSQSVEMTLFLANPDAKAGSAEDSFSYEKYVCNYV